MPKKILIPIFLLVFTFILAMGAAAKNDANKFQEKVDQRAQKREQVCENFQEKAAQRAAKFGENRSANAGKYNKLVERLTDIIAKLKAKGYNVAELEADVEVLIGWIEEYDDTYASFIESMGFVKGFGCGSADNDFRAALNDAKELRWTLQDIRGRIQDLYRTEIREDLKDIREQAKLIKDGGVVESFETERAE